MRTYNKQYGRETIKPLLRLNKITEETKLVSTKDASTMLRENKGLSMSPKTISEHCRLGKWVQGYHWVKSGKQYLINMSAVYQTITSVN